nr:EOG090X0FVI [Daphnia magna]
MFLFFTTPSSTSSFRSSTCQELQITELMASILDSLHAHAILRKGQNQIKANLCCRLSALSLLISFSLQGWYIVTYALGIYHLNLFIAFLSPKIDPAMSEFEESEDGPELPTKVNEEFRPFIRRLPEFKFWYSVSKSTVIAVFCTFFEVFNVPVFWPILVMYFITLFCLTMKRQIKHMIKYRYIPFTHGKPKYQVDNSKGFSGAIPKK